jgi:hypothetical protein
MNDSRGVPRSIEAIGNDPKSVVASTDVQTIKISLKYWASSAEKPVPHERGKSGSESDGYCLWLLVYFQEENDAARWSREGAGRSL